MHSLLWRVSPRSPCPGTQGPSWSLSRSVGGPLPTGVFCSSPAFSRAVVPMWLLGPGEADRVPRLWGRTRACTILSSPGVEEGVVTGGCERPAQKEVCAHEVAGEGGITGV